jgi:hypothetical protein
VSDFKVAAFVMREPLYGIQEKPTAQTAHLVFFADTQSQR